MTLSSGSRLGSYEILSPLGAGGMGEVYRAKDVKLGRDVAIKVLPTSLAADPERLARFEREARVLASLNHPNIAAIYGVEDSTAVKALVLELVDGTTLQDRIAQGPIPLEEARACALQIAEALEAAHEKGVVHRDLKPANIKLDPNGNVKVLDFGLAKALDPAAGSAPDISHSPTITYQATAAEIILGTAAYMSPEQARGRPVDKRADIWAFGVVLWEMLTGTRLFRGDNVSDTLAEVLKNEFDYSRLPETTPVSVRRLLRRCLERNPVNRLRDIGDAALELADAARSPQPDAAPAPAPARSTGRSARALWFAVTTAAIAGSIAAWALVRVGSRGGPSASSVSFELKTFDQQAIYGARFLPDGHGIVHSAAPTGNLPELFLLSPGAEAPKRLGGPGTDILSVSADGELAVLTGATYILHRVLAGTLARMSLDGSPRPLVDGVRDADWGPDGTLAIVRRVADADRLEYPIGTVLYETSGYVSEPRVSRDGREVAFLDHQWWRDDRGRVKVVDRSGRVKVLTDEYAGLEGLTWSADDRKLLFSATRNNWDLHFQPQAVAISGGKPAPVLSVPGSFIVLDVAPDGDWLALQEQERAGVAVHLPGRGPDLDLTWLDSSWDPSLSPDGKTLLFTNGRGGPNYTVVTRRLDGSPITTLGQGYAVGYSPDGRWVAAKIADPPSIVVYPTGAGSPRVLARGPIEKFGDVQWFPDGSALLIAASTPSHPARDYRQSIAGGLPEPVTPEGITGSLRPDGSAVLALDESDSWVRYPIGNGTPLPVRGLRPEDFVAAWSRDGSNVFVYRPGDVPARVERVDLATGKRSPAFTIAPEQRTGLVSIRLQQPVYEPGQSYAYGYVDQLAKLYVVHGVGR